MGDLGSFVLGFGVAFLVIYLIVLAVLTYVSIRPPRIHQFVSPGMMGFEQHSFTVTTSDGVEIGGWHVPNDGETLIIACHGYLVNRSEWVPTCSFLIPRGASLVFFDHRGQGRSGAARVTMGRDEAKDVLAVLDWAKQEYPDKMVVLLGSSMGAVAATLAAVEQPDRVAGLVLDAPYRNLDEASREWWSFLGGKYLKFWMQPIRIIGPIVLGFRPETVDIEHSLSKIQHIPTLLMFGTKDPIVQRASALALKKSAGQKTELLWFEGATHGAGRLRHPEQFQKSMLQFMEEHQLLRKQVMSDARTAKGVDTGVQ